jgi:hypothetical protein
LVGLFEFVEWNGDDHLRHSKFVSMQDDTGFPGMEGAILNNLWPVMVFDRMWEASAPASTACDSNC